MKKHFSYGKILPRFFLKTLILAGFYHIGSTLEKSTMEDIVGVLCESDKESYYETGRQTKQNSLMCFGETLIKKMDEQDGK